MNLNNNNANNVTANNNVNANVSSAIAAATTRESARAIVAFDEATKNSMLKREGMLNEVCSAHERAGLTIDTANIGGIDGMQPFPSRELSAREFRVASFDAYMAYLAWANDEISDEEELSKIAPLCAIYGLDVTGYTLTRVFGFALYAFGKAEGDALEDGVVIKQRRIKSIATFRKFIKGGYTAYIGRGVAGNAGKEPAPLKPKAEKKPKKATKAELEAALVAQAAENERLLAELAALKAGNSAAQ